MPVDQRPVEREIGPPNVVHMELGSTIDEQLYGAEVATVGSEPQRSDPVVGLRIHLGAAFERLSNPNEVAGLGGYPQVIVQ
jgi:hypothetical protein